MSARAKSAGSGRGPELPLGEPVKVGETPPPRDHVTPATGPVSSGAAVVKPERAGRAPAVAAATNGVGSIHQLLQQAIDKGAGVDALEKLVGLHERVTAREAALEFARALAAFQEQCPAIGKVKTAEITTKAGGKYKYTYAPLDEIVRVVKPLLTQHGFSYGWDSKVDSGSLTCVCTLRHYNGHSTTASFTLPIENPSAMSPQQKVGAALTFAQRKTLESVLGLNTTEEDTDAVVREIDPTPVSDDQLAHLEDLLTEIKADRGRFLQYLDVENLEKLPAGRYREAVAALEQKRAGRKHA